MKACSSRGEGEKTEFTGGECYRARAKTPPRYKISLMHPIRVQRAGTLFQHLSPKLQTVKQSSKRDQVKKVEEEEIG